MEEECLCLSIWITETGAALAASWIEAVDRGNPLSGSPGPCETTTEVQSSQLQADGGIRFERHNLQRVQELLALTDEEAVGCEARDGSHSAREFVGQRTNDGDMRELGAEELARHGKNQAGLNQVGWFQRWIVEKIRERQARDGIRE